MDLPLRGRTAGAPLQSSAFRRYLAGQLLSVSCSWAQVVAVSWVVVQLDPAALGWVVVAQFLPSLVLGPWFGAVVDRHDQRRLLLLAELGLGLVALGYAAAALTDHLDLTAVYLLATGWGVINALDTPARRSLIPLLVPKEHAASASALGGTVMMLGMAVGTAVGAVLVDTAGVGTAFLINAASFLIDVVILASLRAPAAVRVPRAPGQVREGLVYVWATLRLRSAMLTLAVVAIFGFHIQVSVPVLAGATFGGGPGLVGGLFTAVTVGSLVGTLLFAARPDPEVRGPVRPAIMMAAGLAVVAGSVNAPMAWIGLLVLGSAWSYLISVVVAVLLSADPRLMGRVMSLLAVVLLGGTTVGAPLATAMIALLGPRTPFAIGAFAVLAAATISRRSMLSLAEGAEPGRVVVGIDGDRPDRSSETVAEGQQPSGEFPDLAVGTQDGQVGGHVLDLRIGHGPVETLPMGLAQRLGNEDVDRLPHHR